MFVGYQCIPIVLACPNTISANLHKFITNSITYLDLMFLSPMFSWRSRMLDCSLDYWIPWLHYDLWSLLLIVSYHTDLQKMKPLSFSFKQWEELDLFMPRAQSSHLERSSLPTFFLKKEKLLALAFSFSFESGINRVLVCFWQFPIIFSWFLLRWDSIALGSEMMLSFQQNWFNIKSANNPGGYMGNRLASNHCN